MAHFKNKAESFYREIRSIEIYNGEDISFFQVFKGIFPSPDQVIFSFDIVPESYGRKISTKTQGGNYYTEIDVNFPLLDMSVENIELCYEKFNKKSFAVVLVSNTQKMVLGNDREMLKVEFLDNIKDDNSGNDEYTIAISGESIIPPKIKKL